MIAIDFIRFVHPAGWCVEKMLETFQVMLFGC